MANTPQLGTCEIEWAHAKRPHPEGYCVPNCVNWSPLPTPKEGPGMTPEPSGTGVRITEPVEGLVIVNNPGHRMTSKINMTEWLESEHIEGSESSPPVPSLGVEDVARLLEGTTPGPWEIYCQSEDEGWAEIRGYEGHIRSTTDDSADWCAQSISVEANARLIAAVPSLAADLGEVIRQRDEAMELLRATHEANVEPHHEDQAPDCHVCAFLPSLLSPTKESR